MNRTYQPSGRVSCLFVPVYFVMLTMAFISAFACVFCIQFSPYSVLDAFLCYAITKGVAKYGGIWSVKYGKVRSPFWASVSGGIAALWYGYLMIVFYQPVKEMFRSASFEIIKGMPGQLINMLSPHSFCRTINEIKNRGMAITGKSGNTFFVVPGSICIFLLVVFGIIMAVYFIVVFCRPGRYPYFEDSGRWAKEIIMPCSLPENEELYIASLLLGETEKLAQLEPLSEVNVDHYMLSLFAGGGAEQYYVSLSRMENSGEVDRRTGKMVFEEKELVEYLALDRDTGNALFMRRPDAEEDAAVRVVTDESEEKAKRWLIFDWAVSLMMILFGAAAIFKIDRADLPRFMMKGGFFYFAVLFLGNAVRFIRSFQKETVIKSTETRFEYDGTKKYLGVETTEPVIYKLFYLFLMISAAVLFGICIWRMQ